MVSREINTQELLRLIHENPDLPVVPLVSDDAVSSDYNYTAASFGGSRVDEYLVCKKYDRILFKSENDVFGTLEYYLSDEEFEELPVDESDCRPFYDALPWTKAIIVFIEAW